MKQARRYSLCALLLFFVSIHPQTLLAFVGSYLMSFSFFTTRHVGRCFLMGYSR
jgi:hypothetical protein